MRNTGPTPEFIWLSVSNVCNLSCPFCVHGWTDIDVAQVCGSDRKFIDVNRFRQMVDEISEYNTFLGLVGSGETMLHPEIYDMLAYASLEKNVLHIEDVDMLDGTPLIDIKPYIKRFDSREHVRSGWQEHIDDEVAKARGRRASKIAHD